MNRENFETWHCSPTSRLVLPLLVTFSTQQSSCAPSGSRENLEEVTFRLFNRRPHPGLTINADDPSPCRQCRQKGRSRCILDRSGGSRSTRAAPGFIFKDQHHHLRVVCLPRLSLANRGATSIERVWWTTTWAPPPAQIGNSRTDLILVGMILPAVCPLSSVIEKFHCICNSETQSNRVAL